MPSHKNCRACAHSYMEPDEPCLICGHKDAGTFGINLRYPPADHCKNYKKFKQHPLRMPNGDLKRSQ